MTRPDSTPADGRAPDAATVTRGSEAPRDPVTGRDDNPTGDAQAAENERTDPVA
ncbi:hypothetical protein [Nakamurella flava]|uniref:hypothetical protein n=1 Tax=Nakamurella flava TaxID=2576308 RepID=UPI00140A6770|nr:hypothetical protein [Nakamurella flava]